MNTDDFTLQTYNKSAAKFADYFSNIGARTQDITIALGLLKKPEMWLP